MLTIFIATILLTVSTNGCSLAYPADGTTYISNVQLLSERDYPNMVLLTIQRTSRQQWATFNTPSRLNYVNNGPWCKMMDINNGFISDVVPCSDYTSYIRQFTPTDTDPKSTSVSCTDNCDGATATCIILRDGIEYIFDNIIYLGSSTNCASSTTPVVYFGSIFISFTINDISTTYISFSTNMVGIQFNDNTSPVGIQIYNVDRQGDWNYLIPQQYGIDNTPSLYSAANIIKVALPCCLCYGSTLKLYSIITDLSSMTQVFSMKSLGFGGGQVDVIQKKVFNYGMSFSKSITVYNLIDGGVANTFSPNLCDMLVPCSRVPCDQPNNSNLGCPYNVNARCVSDYCGGCNAKWFCGTSDITNMCDSAQTSNRVCPSQTVTGRTTTL